MNHVTICSKDGTKSVTPRPSIPPHSKEIVLNTPNIDPLSRDLNDVGPSGHIGFVVLANDGSPVRNNNRGCGKLRSIVYRYIGHARRVSKSHPRSTVLHAVVKGAAHVNETDIPVGCCLSTAAGKPMLTGSQGEMVIRLFRNTKFATRSGRYHGAAGVRVVYI